jgi:hypothetical protein
VTTPPRRPVSCPSMVPAAAPRLLAFATLPAILAGCGGAFQSWTAAPGAEVTVEGRGNRPGEFASELPISVYAVRPAEETHWSSDRSLEELSRGDFDSARFLHVQLLWEPIAGKTSIARTATNVVTRLVIVSGDEVGVYAGGGFAWPWGDPGDDDRTLVITGSSMSLIARTKGFVDLLSPAQITGTVVSRHDPDGTVRWRRAVSQIVTNRLERTQWVDASGEPLDLAAAKALLDGPPGPS